MIDGQVYQKTELLAALEKARENNVMLVILREYSESEQMRFESMKEAINEIREYEATDKFVIVKVFY